jgi:hypothetical protein
MVLNGTHGRFPTSSSSALALQKDSGQMLTDANDRYQVSGRNPMSTDLSHESLCCPILVQ